MFDGGANPVKAATLSKIPSIQVGSTILAARNPTRQIVLPCRVGLPQLARSASE